MAAGDTGQGAAAGEHRFLRTGAQYIASQRDGRQVYYKGEVIEDVATHPATGGGVQTIARLYDQQHAAPTQDVMTYLRPDGERATVSFMVPRTKEDLRRRRAATATCRGCCWPPCCWRR